MSDFPTMSASSQAALRDALAGKITKIRSIYRQGALWLLWSLVETTRSATLAAVEPPVWETKQGISVFCPDHQPACPGCGGHPDRLIEISAWTGIHSGDVDGLVCEDCASALRRRISETYDEIVEAAEESGEEPRSDDLPSFESRGDVAWKMRNPIARLLTR